MNVIGLDVGGANLKAADGRGTARSVPFALWKNPAGLADELRRVLNAMPRADLVAVTMTGELCDCYETKREGVLAILDAVDAAADDVPIRVWTLDGRFVGWEEALASPLQAAAANWLALATFAGRYAPTGPALLIDVGSTTTDLIPLMDGKPVPIGRTDYERLRSGELVYTGIRRTPVCAMFMSRTMAAELFATSLDAYLMLGLIPEDPSDCDTADGRPATRFHAHARLARMFCCDAETCTAEEARALAKVAVESQIERISSAANYDATRKKAMPESVLLAGSGGAIVWPSLEKDIPVPPHRVVHLERRLCKAVSDAGCAHAVAVLAAEEAAR